MVQHAAAVLLVLLTACSECLLFSRAPGCQAEAVREAEKAVEWSHACGISPATAHRQLGRVHRETGAVEKAEAELRQVRTCLPYLSMMCVCLRPRRS